MTNKTAAAKNNQSTRGRKNKGKTNKRRPVQKVTEKSDVPKVIHLPIRFRVGENERRARFVPALGEPIYTKDDKRLWIGDGKTPGGIPTTVSQFHVGKLDDVYEIDDAEVGDFAIIARHRLLMYIGPDYTNPRSWFELAVVTPPEEQEKYWANMMINEILQWLENYRVDKCIKAHKYLDEEYCVSDLTDGEYEALIMDRYVLHHYLDRLDGKRPRLEFQRYRSNDSSE